MPTPDFTAKDIAAILDCTEQWATKMLRDRIIRGGYRNTPRGKWLLPKPMWARHVKRMERENGGVA